MGRNGSRRVNFTATYRHDQWDKIVVMAKERSVPKSKIIQELIDLGFTKLRERHVSGKW